MNAQKGAFNLTQALVGTYPVANMIFNNKTLILVTKQHRTNNQQITLLIGMAFIGGIIAGFLVKCIYHGVVKYFMNSMDQIEVQRPSRGNVNPSFVDDSFRHANDEPPDYITVITETSIQSRSEDQCNIEPCKERDDLKIPDENPPSYTSTVAIIGRAIRSATT